MHDIRYHDLQKRLEAMEIQLQSTRIRAGHQSVSSNVLRSTPLYTQSTSQQFVDKDSNQRQVGVQSPLSILEADAPPNCSPVFGDSVRNKESKQEVRWSRAAEKWESTVGPLTSSKSEALGEALPSSQVRNDKKESSKYRTRAGALFLSGEMSENF